MYNSLPYLITFNYLPSLHVKLGSIKQCVRALHKDGQCFSSLETKFSGVSAGKLKKSIFFIKDVLENFLGNHKSKNYKKPVDLLKSYNSLGCL